MKKTNKVLVAGALGFALLAGTLGNAGIAGAASKSAPSTVVALPDSGVVYKGTPLKVKPPVLPKKATPVAKAAVAKKIAPTKPVKPEPIKLKPIKKPVTPPPIVKSPVKPIIKKPVQPAPIKVDAKKPVEVKKPIVGKPVVTPPVVKKPVIVAPPIVKVDDPTRYVVPEVTKAEFVALGFASKEFTADQNGFQFKDFSNFDAYKAKRIELFNLDVPMAKDYWALNDQDITPVLKEEFKNDVYKAATFFNVFE